MTDKTDRCPICDRNVLMAFQKKLSPSEIEKVLLCANPPCSALFKLIAPNKLQLMDCADPTALENFPEPMTETEWFAIWKTNHITK